MALYSGELVLVDPGQAENVVDLYSSEVGFLKLLRKAGRLLFKQWKMSWEVRGPYTQANPAVVEGTPKTSGYRSYLGQVAECVLQIVRSEGYGVTRQANAMATASKRAGQHIGEQIEEDAKNWAITLEKVLLSNQELVVGDANTAYKTRGAMRFLQTTAQAVLPMPSIGRPATEYTGALADLDEAAFIELLRLCYVQLRKPVDLVGLAGSLLKQQMNTFLRRVTATTDVRELAANIDALSKEVGLQAEWFRYEFGEVRTILTPNIMCDLSAGGAATAYTERSGLFIMPKLWKLGHLSGLEMQQYPQTDNGEGPHGYHESTTGLVCDSGAGQFRVLSNT
jgi:hypothetical protein